MQTRQGGQNAAQTLKIAISESPPPATTGSVLTKLALPQGTTTHGVESLPRDKASHEPETGRAASQHGQSAVLVVPHSSLSWPPRADASQAPGCASHSTEERLGRSDSRAKVADVSAFHHLGIAWSAATATRSSVDGTTRPPPPWGSGGSAALGRLRTP